MLHVAHSMNRREFLSQAEMLAVGVAMLPRQDVFAQQQMDLLEFSAIAAIAAMQKGELKAED
jgi:hypothetical protein